MKTLHKIVFPILLVLGVLGRSSSAQTATATATESYQLKHRSDFALQATQHNPFWPIGWEKGAAVSSSQQESQVPISAQNFVVTGISISSPPMAMINGQNYAEGETITAMFGGQKVKILVVTINDGSVVLQYLNKKYVIALRRPELNTKVPQQEFTPQQDKPMILR